MGDRTSSFDECPRDATVADLIPVTEMQRMYRGSYIQVDYGLVSTEKGGVLKRYGKQEKKREKKELRTVVYLG